LDFAPDLSLKLGTNGARGFQPSSPGRRIFLCVHAANWPGLLCRCHQLIEPGPFAFGEISSRTIVPAAQNDLGASWKK
jgi:hypothetical protein